MRQWVAPNVYRDLRTVYMAQRLDKPAAIAAIQVILTDDSAGEDDWKLFEVAEQRLGQTKELFARSADGKRKMNANDPIVRQQLVEAYNDMIKAIVSGGDREAAAKLFNILVEKYHFTGDEFSDAMVEQPRRLLPAPLYFEPALEKSPSTFPSRHLSGND